MFRTLEERDEFRRKRLTDLIAQRFNNTQAALASAMGLKNSTLISHYLTSSSP